MADIAPDEEIPPSLAALGADSEVSSVGSSQEGSNSAQPVDNNGTDPAFATAAESSGSDPNSTDANGSSSGSTSSNNALADADNADDKAVAGLEKAGKTADDKAVDALADAKTADPKPPAAIKSRTSFTADSPYFTSFCDGEIKSLNTLSNSLRDISARTNTFCRTGALMSEAMHRLANSCKLRPERNLSQDHPDEERHEREDVVQQRRHAVGEEMAKLLQLLGEVSLFVCLFVRVQTTSGSVRLILASGVYEYILYFTHVCMPRSYAMHQS